MLQKLRNTNEKGFTLIELMIVIAIIGILAAIAIPNFISYRNKAYCSAAERDATSVAAGIADYFSIPTNTTVSVEALTGTNATGRTYVGQTLTNNNTWNIDTSDDDAIVITVNDVSTRCPQDYTDAMTAANNPRGYWSTNDYIKIMTMND
jgi:type IV pilus assembly protein PilA